MICFCYISFHSILRKSDISLKIHNKLPKPKTHIFSDKSIAILVHNLEQSLCHGLLAHKLIKKKTTIQIFVFTIEHSLNLVSETISFILM